jgi:multicomponent Na+:H+ antiporter subunit C
MFYVSMGRVENGTAPILMAEDVAHDEGHHDAGKEKKDAAPVAHTPVPKNGSVASGTHEILNMKKVSTRKRQATIGPTTSKASNIVYSNPLPHVLMLTAIVVGVATTALALSLVVRINEHYGTIEEDELEKQGVLI